MPASNASHPTPAWVADERGGPRLFAIPAPTLAALVAEKDTEALQAYGGVVGVAQQLHSDPTSGLSDDRQAHRRREKHYGRNVAPQPSLLAACLLRHANGGTALLMALIIIYVPLSLVLKDPVDHRERWGYYEGGASLVLAGGGRLFLLLLDLVASGLIASARRRSGEKDVAVVRNGKKAIIPSTELLVGDVVHIREGQSLPADCLLLSSQDLRVDESPLNGESTAPAKDELDDPFLIHGTVVLQGFGTALVAAVGPCLRSTGSSGQDRSPPPVGPLHLQVQRTVGRLRRLSMAGPFMLFVTLAVKQGILMLLGAEPSSVLPFLRYAILCLALGLAVAPSCLPWTLSTAYSLQAMLRSHCAVRDEAACEELAAVRALVCNQAVVLQQNTLAVAEGWIAGQRFVMADFRDGALQEDVAVIRSGGQGLPGDSQAVVTTVCESLAMNSVVTCAADPDHMMRGAMDNGMEGALFNFLLSLGHDPVALQLAQPAEDTRCFQFLATKRRMTTVVKRDRGFTVHAKGSSEVLLSECTRFLAKDGQPRVLSLEDRRQVMNFLSLLACKGYRTVVSAVAADIAWDEMPQDEPLGLDYTLTAVFGLAAPVCTEVASTLAACYAAGITVRVVSPDGPELSAAVAQRCGLLGPEQAPANATLRGFDFCRLLEGRPQQLLSLLPQLRLLPRCSAAQRRALTEVLRCHSPSVAVVGHDLDDVAALVAGTVGVAFQSSNEAFGDRAGLLLRDNRLSTLLVALRWSRGLRHNIEQSLQFFCTAAATIFIVTFVGACCFPLSQAPLSAVHLLWLHAVLHPLALLCLSLQRPSAEALQQGPTSPTDPLFTARMLFVIFWLVACQVTSLLVLFFLGAAWFHCVGCIASEQDSAGYCLLGRQHRTLLFNNYMWLQVLTLCCGRVRCDTAFRQAASPLSHIPRLMAISVLATVQAIIVQFAGDYLDLTPLSALQWLGSVAFASSVLIVAPLAHTIPLPTHSRTATPARPSVAPLPIPGPDPDVLLQSICRELTLLRQAQAGDLEANSNFLALSPLRSQAKAPAVVDVSEERMPPVASSQPAKAAVDSDLPMIAGEISFTQAYPASPMLDRLGSPSFAKSAAAVESPPPRKPSHPVAVAMGGAQALPSLASLAPAPQPAGDPLGLTVGPIPLQEGATDVQREQYLKALRALETEMGELNEALSVFSNRQVARRAGVLSSSQESSFLSPASLMEQTLWPEVGTANEDDMAKSSPPNMEPPPPSPPVPPEANPSLPSATTAEAH